MFTAVNEDKENEGKKKNQIWNLKNLYNFQVKIKSLDIINVKL